ncbi:MAG: 30S ribosomal protein S8 [Nanoarchaeota archaeon]
MLNDPLANVLSNIVNAQKVGKQICSARPVSITVKTVLGIMQDNNYLGKIDYTEDNKGHAAVLHIIGKINNCGVIKPRFAVKRDGFEKYEKRYLPAKDFGFLIISTSQGIMTHIEAKKKGIGGRLISYVY